MNICFVIPSEEFARSAGVRIRIDRFSAAASLYSLNVSMRTTKQLSESAEFSDDAYVFVKTFNADSLLLADRMRKRDRLVGIDLFDDYFSQENDFRLSRYRRWLREIAPLLDFALCSTVQMKGVFSRFRPDLEATVLPDPSPPFDPRLLSAVLDAKLQRIEESKRLCVLWFGIGDNPYFDVGLQDLWAHSGEIARALESNLTIDLKVLTNTRALKVHGLSMMKKLPVVPVIEEWTETGEQLALQWADVCFLPVGRQAFSRAKSLNRAVTALMAGCQIVCPGYPLYNPLDDFAYQNFDLMLSGLEKRQLKHSSMQMVKFGLAMEREANPYTSVKALVARLSRLTEHRGSAASSHPLPSLDSQLSPAEIRSKLKTGFWQDRAILHGMKTSIEVHKLAQKLGALSIRSPFTGLNANFDVRFEWADTKRGLRVLVSAELLALVAPQFQSDFKSQVTILDRNCVALEESSAAWDGISFCNAKSVGPFAQAALYRGVMDQVLMLCQTLFPKTICFQHEERISLP